MAQTKMCPKCKYTNGFGMDECIHCHIKMEPLPICDDCGTEIWPFNESCPKCGGRKQTLVRGNVTV